LWGSEDDISHVLGLQQQQQQRLPSIPRPIFDLVVGSDLLYNPDAYPGWLLFHFLSPSECNCSSSSCLAALLRTLITLCPPPPAPPTLVVLAYPLRLSAEARFIASLRAHFEVSVRQLEVEGGRMMVAECRPKLPC
jgi:hypothetical protein